MANVSDIRKIILLMALYGFNADEIMLWLIIFLA